MQTYFQDLKRDNGSPVTVEYSFRNLSAALAEANIVSAFHDRDDGSYTVKLTDAERDRMEAWIVEHHVNE